MVREDWGQDGTAMVPQSAIIRRWLGDAPYLFAVERAEALRAGRKGGHQEVVSFIAPEEPDRVVVSIDSIRGSLGEDSVLAHPITVVHPFEDAACEALQRLVHDQLLTRVFVMVWSEHNMVRTWLDGLGATNLHTEASVAPTAPLLAEAMDMIRGAENNGLRGGRGKDAVVQLLRGFAEEGLPVDSTTWVRAYFASGGSFEYAQDLKTLVDEFNQGVRHRVRAIYRDDIVRVLRERLEEQPPSD